MISEVTAWWLAVSEKSEVFPCRLLRTEDSLVLYVLCPLERFQHECYALKHHRW